MADTFNTHSPGLASPAHNIAAVTPHDTNELANHSRALQATTAAGLIKVTTVHGTTGTLYCALGQIIPIRAKIVWSGTTTATGIVALY